MKKLFLIAAVLLSSHLVFAGDIDLGKSKLYWQGTKVAGRHWGDIKFKSGKVMTKDGALTGAEFVVDMKSFNATDLQGERAQKFNGHMQGADFFEVEKFPTAVLKVKKVEGFTVTADMTIKGVTKEVKFLVANNGKKFVGTLTFDRTAFGIKYGSKSFFKSIGDKAIDNEVSLLFDVVEK
jgi:hypothetical protein